MTGKATKPQDRGKIFFQTVRHAGSCVAIATATVVAAGCGGGGSGNAAAPTPASAPTPSSGASATAFNIEPMTNVDVANHLGYFGDPYPIHSSQPSATAPQSYSGTTTQVLQCTPPITPGCFTSADLQFKYDSSLTSAVSAAGNAFGDTINHNIYQTLDGVWHMVITLYVHPLGAQNPHWTVIAHASPADNTPASTPPSSWIVDKLLVGSLATSDFANYDGKYFEDGNTLYLVYSKRLVSSPVEYDGIVAQAMTSATAPASSDPVTLLAPDRGAASLNSEYFHTKPPAGDTFKLIETGNITKINGKYVMAYSAGDYQQISYKSGVAYSDTFLPQPGQSYRKVYQQDTAGVWGQPNHPEVRYLLQSQQSQWPNYVAAQVLAAGVPAIIEQPNGQYLMSFDAFLPSDAPQAPESPNNPLDIEADHRRPFYLPLNVSVPANVGVSSATDAQLATWITPGME
ncbi:hypothetical protein [Caballeronia sp. 15711]|uniref:hypothetical protein n=1 Tax=Caballeronia sp. 15711 TaxID=3391029 RepID=UPI0039E5A284